MSRRQKQAGTHGSSSSQAAGSTKNRFRKTDKNHPANRPIVQYWDDHDEAFYQEMRAVEICVSRFAHRETTDALGITEEVEALFERIGLGFIFDLQDDTYADLTREFLASARLMYPDPENPVADQGMFSFIVNQQFYSLTLFQLCDIFGFAKGTQSVIPDFRHATEFWKFIASGNYIPREAKQARIRSPVLRYAVRVISSIVFGKTDPAAVSTDELALLFVGTRHLWPESVSFLFPEAHSLNIGAVIAEKLAYYKASDAGKRFGLGAVVTTILRHFRIHLPADDRVMHKKKKLYQDFFDMKSLIASGYLTGPWRRDIPHSAPYVYHFQDRSGRYLYFILPHTALTDLTTRASVEFTPPAQFLCPRPATFKKSKSVATSSSHQHGDEEEDIAENDDSDEETLFPTDFTPYMLPPAPPATASATEINAWSIKSHQTNNSILLKMWKGICSIQKACTSRPAVSGDSDEEEAAAHEEEAAAPEEEVSSAAEDERRTKKRRDRRSA